MKWKSTETDKRGWAEISWTDILIYISNFTMKAIYKCKKKKKALLIVGNGRTLHATIYRMMDFANYESNKQIKESKTLVAYQIWYFRRGK